MRVMIFDDSGDDALETAWRLGAMLYKLRGDVDRVKGVTTIEQMLNWLIGLPEDIEEVQFWGHGWPGRFYIGDKNFSANVVKTYSSLFNMLAEKMDAKSLWWFRTCSTFAGENGQAIAMALADKLGCRVAGHTHIIGMLQGGLRSISFGENPSWTVDDGLGEKGADGWRKNKRTWLWTKNTITCLRGSVPAGW